jgi:hypothetical protein
MGVEASEILKRHFPILAASGQGQTPPGVLNPGVLICEAFHKAPVGC